jgi:hypothetical protein
MTSRTFVKSFEGVLMAIQFMGANIVLVAESHNPTIVSKDWLSSTGILREPPTNFVHMPIVSQFESENFNLVVEENRWQLRARQNSVEIIEQLPAIAERYVRKLPETVYTALGVNFEWRAKDETEDLHKRVTELLVNPAGNLKDFVARPKFLITGNAFFEYEGLRVQIAIAPTPESVKEVRLLCNYHLGITAKESETRIPQLTSGLGRFEDLRINSQQLVEELMGRQ